LFDDDRVTYGRLLEWSPLIEMSVFKLAAVLFQVLDRMRPEVHQAIISDQAQAPALTALYHRMVLTSGRLILLSTDAGGPWLPEMSLSFRWINWTPSFPMVRERSIWTTMVGARAASRFGPGVIDRYLETLGRAHHPLHALDCLIGLGAITLRHPEEQQRVFDGLGRQIAKLRSGKILRPDIVESGYEQVRRLLAVGAGGASANYSRDRDAFALGHDGRLPMFGLMAGAVGCPPIDFIPEGSIDQQWSPELGRQHFLRAWGGAQLDLASLPSSAFGHA
jgi:hypothetical protein